MSNPFLGIITAEFKQMHQDAIDALLTNDALTVPVKFVYTGTAYESCSNCVFDPIGNKSANVFIDGGPIPFRNGQMCPACGGEGQKLSYSTETIYLMMQWNSRGWIPMESNRVQVPDVVLQTQGKTSEVAEKINMVTYIEVQDVNQYGTQRFQKHGESEYVGFNDNDFVLTMWKRI